MNKSKKYFLFSILSLTILIIPFFVSAEIGIPCGRQTGNTFMCRVEDAFTLVNNVLRFFFRIILPILLTVVLFYAGFMFITSGTSSDKIGKAKTIILNILKGLALILFAWAIVYSFFKIIGYDISRGRGGLSEDKLNIGTIDTNSNGFQGINFGDIKDFVNGDINDTTEYKVIPAYNNLNNPSKTKVTINITPKAKTSINIRFTCSAVGFEESNASAEAVIKKDSNVTSFELNLKEYTEYFCTIESNKGSMKFLDETDQGFTTTGVSPQSGFTITKTDFTNPQFIRISYKETQDLYSNTVFLSCYDVDRKNLVFPKQGGVINSATGSDVKTFDFYLPSDFVNLLTNQTQLNCDFIYYEKDTNGNGKETIKKISGTLTPPAFLTTTFRVSDVITRTDSVLVVFNSSMNINPKLSLTCASGGINHIYRSDLVLSADGIVKIDGVNLSTSKNTINTPIGLPVVWQGSGLKPSSFYVCKIEGETLVSASNYDDKQIIKKSTTFNITTPFVPPPKTPESKLMYRVSVGSPVVIFTRHPFMMNTNFNITGPYLSPTPFTQPIPDSVFVPVANGGVVDNSSMNLVCAGISVNGAGIYTAKVSASSDIGYAKNALTMYGQQNLENVSGFAIPITQDIRSGFLHSASYTCTLSFTVDFVPQIRVFFVNTPFYFDPKDIGPIILRVEGVNANTQYAGFTIVASPRVENSVSYVCVNPNDNYRGDTFWPPQALGVRMPVVIPVSSIIPGLKRGLNYKCKVEGVTYQKERLEFLFDLNIP